MRRRHWLGGVAIVCCLLYGGCALVAATPLAFLGNSVMALANAYLVKIALFP